MNGKKQTIRLNESQLKKVVEEAVKRAVNESFEGNYRPEDTRPSENDYRDSLMEVIQDFERCADNALSKLSFTEKKNYTGSRWPQLSQIENKLYRISTDLKKNIPNWKKQLKGYDPSSIHGTIVNESLDEFTLFPNKQVKLFATRDNETNNEIKQELERKHIQFSYYDGNIIVRKKDVDTAKEIINHFKEKLKEKKKQEADFEQRRALERQYNRENPKIVDKTIPWYEKGMSREERLKYDPIYNGDQVKYDLNL